jgi:hypothetical protein
MMLQHMQATPHTVQHSGLDKPHKLPGHGAGAPSQAGAQLLALTPSGACLVHMRHHVVRLGVCGACALHSS